MIKKLLLSLFVVFLVLGCSPNVPQQEVKEKANIEEKGYYLISFGRSKVEVPKSAKIILVNGEYAGFSGCNSMRGKYDIDGNKVKFYIAVSTRKTCPDIDLENVFKKLLLKVDNYEVDGKNMILKSENQEVLNFKER